MLKSNTGASTDADALKAGKEAGIKALKGLDKAKLAFVYAIVDYDIDKLLTGISEELPGVPVIGNTSFTGVITPEGYVTGKDGFLGLLLLDDDELTVGVAASERGGDPRKTGHAIAEKAMAAAGKTVPPDFFYMVASPAEEEFYLKGIAEVMGRVPLFGGSAADNTIEGKWKLYTDSGAFADGAAVAFFYTDKPFANKFTGAYHETSDCGVITKTNGNRTLAEIDGEPALKKYASWRGLNADSLKGGALLAASVVSPLGVKDPLGDLVAIRHPMNGNDDYTVNVGNNLAVNTAVIRMEASVDELIDSAGITLDALKRTFAGKAGAYHIVHCGGRRAAIGDRIDEVAAQLIKAADGVPLVNLTVQQGGKIVLGGKRKGAFYDPTVIADVPADSDVAKDMEIFGPVVPIIGFDTEEEAVKIANQSKFGLCGCVFTSDMKTAARVAGELECGGVVINGASFFRSFEMPFGGYKYSGVGTEGVMSTFDEVSHTKTIVLKNIF